MATVTVDSLLEQINQLPLSEQEKLRNELFTEKKTSPQIPKSKIISINAPFEDRSREYAWLKQHEREYIGKWIALKGDSLIAQGNTGREVFAKVKELGVESALVVLVEDPDIHYIGL